MNRKYKTVANGITSAEEWIKHILRTSENEVLLFNFHYSADALLCVRDEILESLDLPIQTFRNFRIVPCTEQFEETGEDMSVKIYFQNSTRSSVEGWKFVDEGYLDLIRKRKIKVRISVNAY